MKTNEQYFPMVVFVLAVQVGANYVNKIVDAIVSVTIQMYKTNEQYFLVAPLIILHKSVLTFLKY